MNAGSVESVDGVSVSGMCAKTYIQGGALLTALQRNIHVARLTRRLKRQLRSTRSVDSR
jgi:hypothetical protein